MSQPQLIIIEGNIGSGKSTLARKLGKELEARVFIEPVKANPHLENFYKDPVKYAFTMQIWLLRQRFRTYISALRHVLETGQSVILDRSVYSDNVFAFNSYVSQQISGLGYAYYLHLRKKLLDSLPIPSCVLFLDTDPEVCMDRILNLRKRACESTIPLGYLVGLDKAYRQFIGEMRFRGSFVYEVSYNEFADSHVIADVLKQIPPLQTPDADTKKAILECLEEENLKTLMTIDIENELAEIEAVHLPPVSNQMITFNRSQVYQLVDDNDLCADYPIPVIDFSINSNILGEAEDACIMQR